MRNPYHIPRAAHCIGCGGDFPQMHLMIQHRRLHRCGGRFLPADERELVMAARNHWQKYDPFAESRMAYLSDHAKWHYAQYKDMISRFFLLRKRRLDTKEVAVAKVKSSIVFAVDYTNLTEVKKLARRFGKGMTVIKHPDRPNYNIVHTERTDLYHPTWVQYTT